MARPTPLVEHLLRRAGFGATPAERDVFARLNYLEAVGRLVRADPFDVDVDQFLGTPGYVGITTRGAFSPNTVIADARQRWLFRIVHSAAPLREKMALFWHQHFATAYSKIAGVVGNVAATRMLAAKPSEDPAQVRGQIELFRERGLGKFRDLLVAIARDPAMLVWLDGRTNVKARPQENFGRELMELFTVGVEHYVETDVYAAARVFTGWNLASAGRDRDSVSYAYAYRPNQHETSAKTFSFPIYPDGGRTIPARSAASGIQDGIDLIDALAIHPETARRLARRLWVWFVSETETADERFVDTIADVYLRHDTDMSAVVGAVLYTPQFTDARRFYQRYAWPVEFVVRALKEVGYPGFSVNDALTPMVNMGQQLFEPPDVNGWALGPGWFSTAGMLARMNFAASLATNQKFAARDALRSSAATPDALVTAAAGALSLPDLAPDERETLVAYLQAGGAWTGSDAQLLEKAAGLVHLLVGSGEYQFV